MKTTIAALALAAVCAAAHAGSLAEFDSDVRWNSAEHRLLYGGPCTGYATVGPTGQATRDPLYSVTLQCPGFDPAHIVIWHNDLAMVGQYPARILSRTPRSITLITGQSETLQFSFDPSKL